MVRSAVRPSCHSGKRRQTKCRFIYFIFLLERNTQDSSPMTGRHWYTTDRYKVLEKDNRHTPLRAYKEPKVPGATGPIPIKRTTEISKPHPPTTTTPPLLQSNKSLGMILLGPVQNPQNLSSMELQKLYSIAESPPAEWTPFVRPHRQTTQIRPRLYDRINPKE